MLLIEDRLIVVVLALLLDAVLGDPDWLWRRVPHPVVLMGRAVDWTDRTFNQSQDDITARKTSGAVAIVALTICALTAGALLTTVFQATPLAVVAEIVAVAFLVAGRSLYDHVAAVIRALEENGLDGGRAAVARIVGRDPDTLDESGVIRAALESAGENFSDGVVAPVFWYALLGLPGIVAYKLINTADSMIGHLSERHRDFGMAAARLDDAVNWLPARFSGGLIALGAPLSGAHAAGAFTAMRDDAARHRSPNAGWPEAAMAGALGLALAGPRTYAGRVIDDAWMNRTGRKTPGRDDLRSGLTLLMNAQLVHGLAYAVLAFLA